VTIGLGELGITRNQSAKWQLAATLPAADFERYVTTAREPTTAGALRLVQEHQQRQQLIDAIPTRAASLSPY